jgi:ADP-dependent NAD(P)H-hydrate dehydratase / NAD(P)H-hydrate epimerase
MEPVLSAAEMRAVDEAAQRDVPISTLIARAGTAVATEAMSMLGGAYGRRVAVVAGPGNNGNDGRVAARLLARRGARVRLIEAADRVATAAGADLVVDAAFGTGYRGDYDAPDAGGAPVLAVDVPTGLGADLGEAAPGAVRATRTVTFGALKPGLLLNDGPELAGRVAVRPIGLPVRDVAGAIHLVGDDDVVALLPARDRSSHKWSTAVMVVAGSPGMYGAAGFVARAAGRSGAGMVRLGIPGGDPGALPAGSAVARVLASEEFDIEVQADLDRFEALVVGPGLGTSRGTTEAVRRLVASASVPTVVDADGLTALGDVSGARDVIGSSRRAPVILTPHDGEFARMYGRPPGADRIGAARDLAARVGAVVLLKGSTTVVASPDGAVLLAASGSGRLATAGSGDVLSGVIGAFLARGVAASAAAAVGAHVHGLAAGLGRAEGLVAEDLPELVSDVLSRAAIVRDASAGAVGATGAVGSALTPERRDGLPGG